jgi:DNA-binding NtrC family response regulator
MKSKEASSETEIKLWVAPPLPLIKKSRKAVAIALAKNIVGEEELEGIEDELFESVLGYSREELTISNIPEVQPKIEKYTKMLEGNPDSLPIKDKLAELYIKLKDFNKAAEYYTDVTIQKNDTWSYYNLGTIYLYARDTTKARESLSKAIKLDPNDIHAKYNFGRSYMEENIDEAVKVFQGIIKSRSYSNPADIALSYTYNNLGVCYYHTISDEQQRIEKAYEEFQRAGSIGENNLLLMIQKRFQFSEKNQEEAEEIKILGLVGSSQKIQEVRSLIKRIASINDPVLITGESGTGKEIASKAIHYLSDRRKTVITITDREYKDASKEIITINCATLMSDEASIYLFGLEANTSTGAKSSEGIFEKYEGGTIILDEIGDLHPDIQSKLLRVIGNGFYQKVGGLKTLESKVKIVAVTNKDLEKEVEEGRFRRDLFNRLRIISIKMPPLREHPEDIPELVQYFLWKHTPQGQRTKAISKPVIEILKSQSWEDDNVNGLQTVIIRCIKLIDDQVIYPHHLKAGIIGNLVINEDTEKEMIISTLRITSGKVTQAAGFLGWNRSMLNRRIKEYGINTKEF